ncbi:hypothetical protein AVEN_126390-1 [Araneus ventricosus]|uniref:Uncharacterized protein n=1 Tax=Araneus ventricosus TaxID=182803 RepID=A0A4Y2GHV8_ARAVE|nr:hypothetical protein AVEN_126390-1 [Araneus ventricosus]
MRDVPKVSFVMHFHKEALLQRETYNGIIKYNLLSISPHISDRHFYICRTVKFISRNHPCKNRCSASLESYSQPPAPLRHSFSFFDHRKRWDMDSKLNPKNESLDDVEQSQHTRNEKIQIVALLRAGNAGSVL